MRATISKWGDGLGIRLPKRLVAALGLTEGTKVNLSIQNGGIVLAVATPTFRLEELLIGMTPESMHDVFDWGPDIGRENVE